MEVNVPVIGESWDLEEVLHLLVDASFYQWLMIINALKYHYTQRNFKSGQSYGA